ncbi:hypothetical protein LUZ60_001940 [Juncus effusus]|nr:hypothetical protein LUZ60_001940 [Juncus effusus]
MEKSPRHLLRLALSCRHITAEVTSPPPHSQTIIAMASSTESEFTTLTRLARFHRSKFVWDEKVSARVGEILAQRLIRIGVGGVDLDLDEEVKRPGYLRRLLSPFFESVVRSGVRVEGVEKLRWP